MNLKQFIKKLSQVDDVQWQLITGGRIRTQEIFFGRDFNYHRGLCCPITSIGDKCPVENFYFYSHLLGLPDALSSAIVLAADNIDDGWPHSSNILELRNILLKTCKLDEVTL